MNRSMVNTEKSDDDSDQNQSSISIEELTKFMNGFLDKTIKNYSEKINDLNMKKELESLDTVALVFKGIYMALLFFNCMTESNPNSES